MGRERHSQPLYKLHITWWFYQRSLDILINNYDEDVSSSGEGVVVDSGVYSFADDVVCAKEEGNEEEVEKIEVGDERRRLSRVTRR